MNVGDLNKVWEIKALKKPGEDEARKILERVAKQVQPIMHKRKWRVKLLSEFCPNNRALLGLNVGGGVQVKLRLRRPNREWDFFPFNQILDTMLHELCHNAHGPHNASFYKLWDELRKECEELMTKGISGTGEGFDIPGRRLGGFSRQPPLSSLRVTALAAAEKRVRQASLLPSGSHRLGGDSTIMAALSPIQAAAMAAERRLQDDIWCGSQSAEALKDDENGVYVLEDSVSLGEASSSRDDNVAAQHNLETRHGKRSGGSDGGCSYNGPESKLVDLTDDVSGSKHFSPESARSSKRPCDAERKFGLEVLHKASSSKLDGNSTKDSAMWECRTCTLLNPPLAPLCELCGTEKPKDSAARYKIWACKLCTLENDVKLDKCAACGQWRYSTGPPVSARPPHVGT